VSINGAYSRGLNSEDSGGQVGSLLECYVPFQRKEYTKPRERNIHAFSYRKGKTLLTIGLPVPNLSTGKIEGRQKLRGLDSERVTQTTSDSVRLYRRCAGSDRFDISPLRIEGNFQVVRGGFNASKTWEEPERG